MIAIKVEPQKYDIYTLAERCHHSYISKINATCEVFSSYYMEPETLTRSENRIKMDMTYEFMLLVSKLCDAHSGRKKYGSIR